MSETNRGQYPHLIIGGTTKAATTSLFYYLADHPEVCVTSIKETRFFIDENYPIQPNASKWQDGLETFDIFFNIKEKRLRVDATPDYLYSVGTPQRLKELLPNAKVVFILRNPITRMISWYKFAKQRENIPSSITFSDYIEKQLAGNYFEQAKQQRITDSKNAHDVPPGYFLSALEHGRYVNYLQSYFNVLGKDKVKVFFYEELCADPKKLLRNICTFTSIDPEFYEDYDFQVFNKSKTMKNARLNSLYSNFRWSVRRWTHNLPIHKVLRQMRLWFDPIYYHFNSQEDEQVELSPDIYQKLEAYYQADIVELESLLGCSVPWSIKQNIKANSN